MLPASVASVDVLLGTVVLLESVVSVDVLLDGSLESLGSTEAFPDVWPGPLGSLEALPEVSPGPLGSSEPLSDVSPVPLGSPSPDVKPGSVEPSESAADVPGAVALAISWSSGPEQDEPMAIIRQSGQWPVASGRGSTSPPARRPGECVVLEGLQSLRWWPVSSGTAHVNVLQARSSQNRHRSSDTTVLGLTGHSTTARRPRHRHPWRGPTGRDSQSARY